MGAELQDEAIVWAEPVGTAAAIAARMRLYQPTTTPKHLAQEVIETAYGSLKVVGKLGQRHAAVMEAIMFHRLAVRIYAKPLRVALIDVDPGAIRRALSPKGYSGQGLLDLVRDLKDARLEWSVGGKIVAIDGLIERWETAYRAPNHLARARHPGATNPGRYSDSREIWRVRLGPFGVWLMSEEIQVWYDPAPISRLTYGHSQAVARWVLTHRSENEPRGGWKLDTILTSVLGQVAPSEIRNARRRVRAEAESLLALGVRIEDDRVHIIAS